MSGLSLTQTAISGLKWNYGGLFVKHLCTFAIGLILARLLGPTPFGIVAIAMLLCGFASLIADFGFSAALVQRERLTEQDIRFAFTVQLLVAIFLTACTIAAAPLFARLFDQPTAVPVIRVLSAIFTIQAPGQVAGALLKRELRFRDLQSGLIGSYVLAYGALGIPLAILGHGVWSLVAAQIAQASLRSGWQYARAPHPLGFAMRSSDSGLSVFGTTVIATNIANWCISNLDSAFIGRFFAAAELGFYNRMFVLVIAPVDAVVSTLQQVLFPAYSRAQFSREAQSRTYLASVAVVLLFVAPAALVAAAVPETLIDTLLGPEWLPAASIMVPLALAAPFHAVMAMAGPALWGRGSVASELSVQTVVALASVAALSVASSYSVAAIAWAIAGIYVLRCFMVTQALTRKQVIRARLVVASVIPALFLAGLVATAVLTTDTALKRVGTSAPMRFVIDTTVYGGLQVALPIVAPRTFLASSLLDTLARLRPNLPSYFERVLRLIVVEPA